MYRISFYVPPESLEEVKEAVFTAGAGTIGNYKRCCWETRGTGQFQSFGAANPYIGKHGGLVRITEVKVEMVCEDDDVSAALSALVKAHPYEEPAYAAWPVFSADSFDSLHSGIE